MLSFFCGGVMSGTSMDGMDAVLFEVQDDNQCYHIKTLVHGYRPYPQSVRTMIVKIAEQQNLIHGHLLGQLWSDVVADLIQDMIAKAGLTLDQLDCIAVHGQTLYHQPQPQVFLGRRRRLTLQVADLSRIAVLTGVTTVGNFRLADMAAGGQGAPLAPHGHRHLFGKPGSMTAVQNMGGIGNVTVLKGQEVALAFDTGPGNVWLDLTVRWHTHGKKSMDRHGKLAARGVASEPVVAALLKHPYFRKTPPKSTGWEMLGESHLAKVKKSLLKLSLVDALATVTQATALATAQAYQMYIMPYFAAERIIVAGGGAKNPTLINLLQRYLPGPHIVSSDQVGVASDQVEALAFGLMGLDRMRGRINTYPAATGAKMSTVAGECAWGWRTPHIDRWKRAWLG